MECFTIFISVSVSIIGAVIQFAMLSVAKKSMKQAQENVERQIQIQMFSNYMHRHWVLLLEMPNSVLCKNMTEERAIKLKYFRSYFDLCYEVYLLWKDKGLTDAAWTTWLEQMRIAFNHDVFKNTWTELSSLYSTEFWQYINQEVIKYKPKMPEPSQNMAKGIDQ